MGCRRDHRRVAGPDGHVGGRTRGSPGRFVGRGRRRRRGRVALRLLWTPGRHRDEHRVHRRRLCGGRGRPLAGTAVHRATAPPDDLARHVSASRRNIPDSRRTGTRTGHPPKVPFVGTGTPGPSWRSVVVTSETVPGCRSARGGGWNDAEELGPRCTAGRAVYGRG